MSSSSDSDTTDFLAAPNRGRDRPRPYSSLVQVDFAGMSHAGKVRPNNEDHFLLCRFGRYFEAVQTNVPLPEARSEETGYGMVVADGVGGHAAGEEASRLAIDALVNLVLNTPDWLLRVNDQSHQAEVLRRATERYQELNQVLSNEAQIDAKLSGFATTMTVAFSLGRDLFLAHIGDSRAYLLRQGQLQQLTRDHTLAQKLMDEKVIDHTIAAQLRHVITRSLGDHGQRVQPDVKQFSLENQDRLLVCTDGLTEMVEDNVIGEILGSDEPAQTICERLIHRALDAGGKDNVTVSVARFQLP
jgi:serine/threonine protein phosphatase PrpC